MGELEKRIRGLWKGWNVKEIDFFIEEEMEIVEEMRNEFPM